MPEMCGKTVPDDRQRGDPLAGPVRFASPGIAGVRGVVVLGTDPSSYLYRAILWEVFGVPNVICRDVGTSGWQADIPAGYGVVIGAGVVDVPGWGTVRDWIGTRPAVIDIRAAAAMLQAEGLPVLVRTEAGFAEAVVTAFHHGMATAVYPDAPRVRVVESCPGASGFASGDEFHSYHWAPDGRPSLTGWEWDDTAEQWADRERAVAWGRSAASGDAAIIAVTTPAAGAITIMDLGTVDRVPEPSGVEAVAVQVFLGALGRSSSVFGKFVRAYDRYDAFVEAVGGLVSAHPRFARLEQIGASATGLPMWVLKTGHGAPRPAVLLTTAIHSLEWGPTYGVLRFVRFLLHELERGSAYADTFARTHELWWVLCANPDGWTTRAQEAGGINLNRNFPGSWEACTSENVCWDTYNGRFAPVHPGAEKARGPAPGSESETRALMGLLDRHADRVSTLADFHETTAADSFLHQHEEKGSIPDLAYHRELVEGLAASFDGRFYAHSNALAFGSAQSDFTTYHFRERRSLGRLIPGGVAGWQRYAVERGVKSVVVEAAGADCTHYDTVRRTEYAALAAEQVLAAEEGRLLRNPTGAARSVALTLHRRPLRVRCRVYDRSDAMVEDRVETRPESVTRTIPGGGWLSLQYGEP